MSPLKNKKMVGARVIAFGTDHSAFKDQGEIESYIKKVNPEIQVLHCGCHSAASMDYPDVATTVAEAVASGKAAAGVLICGSGIGVSLAANKIPGVRAALCHDITTARLAREHNNANIICAGCRTSGLLVIEEMIKVFLTEKFSEGTRHKQRIGKICGLEKRYSKL